MLNDTLNKIRRLIYILNAFDRGEVFLPKVAKDLGVTLRTVQRDLHILEDAGFPFANVRKGAYCFVEGFSLGRVCMTAREAAMLALTADMAYSLGGPFTDTYRTLHDKVLGHQAESPFFIKITQGQAFKDQKLVKTLEEAISKRKHIVIEYENSKLSGRKISPLKIVWFDGFWYLLAYGKDETILKLRLDKIQNAKLSDTTFIPHAPLEKILNDSASIWFEENRKHKVRLIINAQVAKYFEKRAYFPKQEIVKTAKDGTLTIECAVGRYEEILPTILQWMPHILVQEPKELIDLITKKVNTFKKEQKRYGNN